MFYFFVCFVYCVPVDYTSLQHVDGLTAYNDAMWNPKIMAMFTMGEFDLEVTKAFLDDVACCSY